MAKQLLFNGDARRKLLAGVGELVQEKNREKRERSAAQSKSAKYVGSSKRFCSEKAGL